MKYFWMLIRVGFYASLAVFLTMGAVVVLTQAGGVAAMSSDVVSLAKTSLGPAAFAAATVCGLFAFALTYEKPLAREQ